jgi:hypothetical protein
MSTAISVQSVRLSAVVGAPAAPLTRVAYRVSGALALVAAVAGATTLFIPGVLPVFAVLALVGLVPLFFYLRNLDRRLY